MRTIQIPPPITINNFQFTFKNFVDFLIDGHDKWNKTGKGIRAGQKIQNAFNTDSETVMLDDNLWEELKEVAEDPGEMGYPTLFARSENGEQTKINISKLLLAFIDAISGAE